MHDIAIDTFYLSEVLQIFLRRSYIANPLVILDTYICTNTHICMSIKICVLDEYTFEKEFVL